MVNFDRRTFNSKVFPAIESLVPSPSNTLAMMSGTGPHGNMEMGGMFTTIKVRDDIKPGNCSDPGWYAAPPGTRATRLSSDPNYGDPPRRKL